jgi:hypothetical protein
MTMQITRKKFLDLSLGTIGAVGLGACGGDDGTDDGNNDTGSSGGDDDDTMTDPSMTAADDDDDGSSSMTDPSDSGSSSGDPDSSSGPGDDSSSGPGDDSSSGPGDDSSSSGGGAACTDDPSVTIGSNHPDAHILVVPLADVEAGVDVDYDIQGDSGHPHIVTVTAADFASLQAGDEVMIISSNVSMHTHTITLSCGA